MRKLSTRHQALLEKRAREGSAPRRAPHVRVGVDQDFTKREAAKAAFQDTISKLPELSEKVHKDARLIVVDPPRRLSLVDNYEECLSFIMHLRAMQAKKVSGIAKAENLRWKRHFAMSKIEDLDPAAGLLLAAELDSYNEVKGLRSQDRTWNENVRTFFIESGLFELLNISPQRAGVRPSAGPIRHVLKFRKGSQPDGGQADLLRRELEALCGDSFGPRVPVNNALCEAMTNSHHHAYPEEQVWWPSRPRGNWWATGAWTPSTRTAHMLIYDQGIGIPATLPRSPHWASAIPLLNRIDPERTDAGLIEAALELRRTSTNILGRGRGLYEMTEWIDSTKAGFLRIWSGRGCVTYRPGNVQRTSLAAPFCGTLVEWEVRHG